jgi:sensor histidine kinase regulating citrate/malate metabolism
MKKRNFKYSVAFLVVAAVSISGCAHREVSARLDEKLKNETPVKSSAELSAEATQVFNSIEGLTAHQKQGLVEVHNDVKKNMVFYREQSLKLRSLLIKDLASPDYDSAEVDLIKKRLKTVEHDRLSSLFDGVDRVNAILGRDCQLAARQAAVQKFMESQSGAR